MSEALSDIIYKALFPPEGAIPLAAKRNIPAIDARIKEIGLLAEGKAVENMNKRISDRSESLQLTEQIVRLRDSRNPPMSYREVMRQLGHCITADAARNRYDDYKQRKLQQEAYVALSGGDGVAEPVRTSSATIRNDRIVEKEEEVPQEPSLDEPENLAPTANQKPENAEILQKTPPDQPETPTQDQLPTVQESQIDGKTEKVGPSQQQAIDDAADLRSRALQLRSEGKNVKEIANLLNVRWQWVRGVCASAGRKCDVDGVRQETSHEPDSKTPTGPQPKTLSRAELDERIWKEWNAGKSPDQISDELCAEGYYYGHGSVRTRLEAQGAKL